VISGEILDRASTTGVSMLRLTNSRTW
jgi:hypothetical protein